MGPNPIKFQIQGGEKASPYSLVLGSGLWGGDGVLLLVLLLLPLLHLLGFLPLNLQQRLCSNWLFGDITPTRQLGVGLLGLLQGLLLL